MMMPKKRLSSGIDCNISCRGECFVGAYHSTNRFVKRRSQDAAFSDDRRHQLRRRHVERGVVDVDAIGRSLPAKAVRDFARVTLLDRDLLATGERRVDAADRGGDVKRDVEVPGEDSDAE